MPYSNKPLHIIVGLSGGVDSSVTAYLLKKAGHQVDAIFMKNWEGDDNDEHCPAAQDLADAESVAQQLKIPFSVVNFADQYWQRVFTHFLQEYQAGRTPNPDILCNKEIKFRAFLDYAKQRGADKIATGHYARISPTLRLLKGLDSNKDQSYFLHALDETQLAASLFPVGDLEKSSVRQIAAELKLKTHAKKDSTGICFIGERKFKTFLNDYLPAKPGRIQTIDGQDLGAHDGLMFYTIGQRQGLKLGGMKNKPESPWYVAAKDLSRNILKVVQGDHPALYHNALIVEALHWINPALSPALPATLMAKTRYRQADVPCQLIPLEDGKFLVEFTTPQRAITPGQSIVFYDGDICLGGGIIQHPMTS